MTFTRTQEETKTVTASLATRKPQQNYGTPAKGLFKPTNLDGVSFIQMHPDLKLTIIIIIIIIYHLSMVRKVASIL